ncbi:MAG: hypothetical protein AB1749_13860 [Pseudomonadota bacterium]
MRPTVSLLPIAASTLAAFALVAAIIIAPELAAADQPPNSGSASECADGTLDKESLWPRPSLAGVPLRLDDADERAALESVQKALTEAGDGATYVWHRAHGRLSGFVQPTRSFKDEGGKICRHIVVVLSSGTRTKQTEGVACRLANGLWQLDG